MFNKLRRNSKETASPLATTSPPRSKDHHLHASTRRPVTFYDLPPELRIKIYELVAHNTKLLLFSNSPKLNSLKLKTPSLLFVTRQVRAEYRPILLSLSPVQTHIYNYDFSPLIRLVGSLYSTELKALRTNNNLSISLHLKNYEVVTREPMTLLRRWAVKRSEHLDRLQWSYKLAEDRPGGVSYLAAEKRMRKLAQSQLAVLVLQRSVHESLAAELQPILEAFYVRYGDWQAAKERAWARSESHDPMRIWVD
jgi:hypothetical protein